MRSLALLLPVFLFQLLAFRVLVVFDGGGLWGAVLDVTVEDSMGTVGGRKNQT